MTKNRLMCSLLACITICIYPSWADNSSVTTSASPLIDKPECASNTNVISSINQSGPSTANAAQPNNPTKSKSNPTTKTSLPKKVFSVATALVIGTPVCIVRRSKYEEWYGVNGMIGNSDNKCKKILAGIFWFPCAVITGTCEAPFDAVTNGLMYPAFSKDQLSQGKLIQNN